MDKRIDGEFRTVTVIRSWPAGTASGATALVLDTRELGPIAFEIDLKAIEVLQRQLSDCARILSRAPGKA